MFSSITSRITAPFRALTSCSSRPAVVPAQPDQFIPAHNPVVARSAAQLREVSKIRDQADKRLDRVEKKYTKLRDRVNQTKQGGVQKWSHYDGLIKAEQTRYEILMRLNRNSTAEVLAEARVLNSRKLGDIKEEMLTFRAQQLEARRLEEQAWLHGGG